MFIIKTRQTDAFRSASTQQFYRDLVDFFEAEDPDLFKTLSSAQKMRFAEACHERARGYRLTLAASIYAWADVSILVGSCFHQDVFFTPVVDEIEKARFAFDERECMERAQRWVSEYLLAVRGEANQYAVEALRRIRGFYDRHQDPSATFTTDEQRLADYITALTAEIHPQLYAFHGRSLVREQCIRLLHHSQSQYGITGQWHLTCMCILGLSFGAGFDRDEVYPWIARTLERLPKLGPENCVEKLATRSVIWMDRVLKNETSQHE